MDASGAAQRVLTGQEPSKTLAQASKMSRKLRPLRIFESSVDAASLTIDFTQEEAGVAKTSTSSTIPRCRPRQWKRLRAPQPP